MNSKNEFNHPPITRITVDRNKKQKSKILPNSAQPSLWYEATNWFLFGTEEMHLYIHSSTTQQNMLSSDQDIYIESTILTSFSV